MTTIPSLPVTIPVTTPRGSRIPKVGTLACHPLIGFATVVSRTQSSVRILLDEIADAEPVTLRDGSVVTRKAWVARVAAASLDGAKQECAHLDARRDGVCSQTGRGAPLYLQDAFIDAKVRVKTAKKSIMSRVRKANEMLVSIDGAEACGWEFDEYATWTPLKNIKKAKAPKPVVPEAVPSSIGTVEDPEMADWMVAEMNECFGDAWTATADRLPPLAPHPDYVPNA